MNDWTDHGHKRAAKTAFCTELNKPENKKLRERCIKYPALARAKFAEWGNFYLEENAPAGLENTAIPLDAEFRIFEEDKPSRNKMVVLVLRTPNSQKDPPDPEQVWQCTYNPY